MNRHIHDAMRRPLAEPLGLSRWQLGATTQFFCAALTVMLAGCGGSYVDDKHNFERALLFQRPKDVQVAHSIYWQSPHFTDEHCYFLELQPSDISTILTTLTNLPDVVAFADNQREIPPSLAVERPKWFATSPRSTYEVWTSTNRFNTFGVLRDKKNGRIFVYGQIL
jgi:hypothetical protein